MSGRRWYVHVNRGLLGWGVFFIVLGAVPLAVRSGSLDETIVLRAWELWPLILIGIGLALLLQRTKAAVVGGLVVAVTAGLMFGSLLAAGIEGIGNGGFATCGLGVGGGDRVPFADQRGTLGSDARVTLELDCGELEVTTAAGDGWTLTGASRDGRPPDVSSTAGRLSITPTDTSPGDVTFGTGEGVAWSVALPRAPRTALDLSVNAGSARLVLDEMTFDGVSATVNAGSANLDLSRSLAVGRIVGAVNAGSLVVSMPAVDASGDLTANAGSIELCVPEDVDLRIRVADNALGSTNFDERGMSQDGDLWTSPGYGLGDAQVDLSVSANLGSVTLNPEDGCE